MSSLKSYNVNEILDRLKEETGLNSDAELSKLLGIKHNTLSGWRTRNSIDLEKLFQVFDAHQVDRLFVLFGNRRLIENELAVRQRLGLNSEEITHLVEEGELQYASRLIAQDETKREKKRQLVISLIKLLDIDESIKSHITTLVEGL